MVSAADVPRNIRVETSSSPNALVDRPVVDDDDGDVRTAPLEYLSKHDPHEFLPPIEDDSGDCVVEHHGDASDEEGGQ